MTREQLLQALADAVDGACDAYVRSEPESSEAYYWQGAFDGALMSLEVISDRWGKWSER